MQICKRNSSRHALTITTLTVMTSRAISTALYIFSDSGRTSVWNNWFLNTFDEYQLGILLVVLSFFIPQWKIWIRSLGIGLLIAECNQILNVFTLNSIPYTFNSPLDWTLTLIALLIVTLNILPL